MPFLDYSQLGVPLEQRHRKDEIRYLCPYCGDERYRLYVNTKKGVFNCFRCNTKGRTNAGDHLSATRGTVAAVDQRLPSTRDRLPLPSAIDGILTPAAERYLARRGILESDCIRHGIYCANTASLYFGRLIVPVDASRGKCKYFTARAYTKLHWPKYLNPPGGKNILYASPTEPDQHHEQFWEPSEILLVEGPFDMLKASRHGPCAALLGKQLAVDVAREIIAKYDRVFIMLDQGIPEVAAAMQLQNQLTSFVDAEILKCPLPDPGEMNPSDFQGLFKWK